MRTRAILLAVFLASPALVGCLGTASAATAEENRDPAEDRAQQWDDQAQLAGVVGLEGQAAHWMGSWGFDYDYEYGGGDYGDYHGGGMQVQSRHAQSSPWAKAAEDGDRGDGRCKIWAYTYVSPNKPDEAFTTIVDEDGDVIANTTEERDGEEPLSNWEIDSDEAAEIAEENNEGIREGRGSDNFAFVFVLEEDPEYSNPTWTVAGGGGDASGGGGGVVVIDAVTGDVLESSGGASGR